MRSQLHGHACKLVRNFGADKVQNEIGAAAIVSVSHLHDPLSVVSEVHADFFELVNCKNGANESFKSFETLFDALVSQFFASWRRYIFLEPLVALQLLNAANVNDSQRASILAACINTLTRSADTDNKTKNAVSIRNLYYYCKRCSK